MRAIYRVAYLVKEGLRALHTHAVLTLMTSLTIAVALVLLGLFLSLYQGLERLSAGLQRELSIVVFLEDDLPEEQLGALRSWLTDRPEVEQVVFTDKEGALASFQARHADGARLVELLGTNPLPASLEARLAPETRTVAVVEGLAAEVETFAGVDGVRYGRDWVAALLGISRWLRVGGVVLGLLLVGATLFIVSNAVRLSIYARREEISIMRMIGATNRFIRGPFYVEGVAEGLAGGLLATLLLYSLQQLGSRLLTPLQEGSAILSAFAVPALGSSQVVALLGMGAALGLLGCWTSLGRFLRV
jgi:cell division transport system permease protein